MALELRLARLRWRLLAAQALTACGSAATRVTSVRRPKSDTLQFVVIAGQDRRSE
jgi:hypothetical protein